MEYIGHQLGHLIGISPWWISNPCDGGTCATLPGALTIRPLSRDNRWRNKTFTTNDTAGEIIIRLLLCLPFQRVSKLFTCDTVAVIGWWHFRYCNSANVSITICLKLFHVVSLRLDFRVSVTFTMAFRAPKPHLSNVISVNVEVVDQWHKCCQTLGALAAFKGPSSSTTGGAKILRWPNPIQ